MIAYSSTYRSSQPELMDNFQLQGKELQRLLKDLKIVNQYLGGFNITKNAIEELLLNHPKEDQITIMDLGCGDGEQLKECALWAIQNGLKVQFIGVDANNHILEIAKRNTESFHAITFKCIDITKDEIPVCDIVLCSLFLHHFSDEFIVSLLQKLTKKVTLGIIVNDLHRSRWAFELFKLFSFLFLKTKIAKHDGLISVASAFKRKELENFSTKIKAIHQQSWHWAFRYKWILKPYSIEH